MMKTSIRRTATTRLLGALALCAAITPVTCLAQSTVVDGFAPTGNLPTGNQVDLNAVTLPDGRVLLTGGYYVEFYSPDSGSFALSANSLIQYHAYGYPGAFTTTLLGNGTVLVAGGSNGISDAEILDPTTQTSTSLSPMNEARSFHTATRLLDGRALITGGMRADTDSDGWIQVESNEIYDPQSGQFTPTGSMSHPRDSAFSTLLADGTVLIAGGYNEHDGGTRYYVQTAEIFDPTTNTFSDTGNIYWPVSTDCATQTRLRDGRVLFTGAYCGYGTSAQIYDPLLGTFSPTGDMQEARSYHSASLLPDGKVLVAGGLIWDFDTNAFVGRDTSEVFDPSTGQFTLSGPMMTARYRHASASLGGGRILVAGGTKGENYPNDFLDSAEIYTSDSIFLDGFDGL